MNKRIDFTFNGGFPATQYMVNFMQESYRSCFMAIANIIGDKVIVQGCDIVGGQVSNGWISFQGELIPFLGGALPVGASVAIVETPASRVFDDQAPHDVYFTKTASLGTPGNFLFSELKRVSVYKDLFDSLTNLINSFNSHSHSWNNITDRPAYFISYRASFALGDVNQTDIMRTVPIPDQGTSNYYVLTTWVGNNNNWDKNNDIAPPNVFNKTSTSFDIGVREVYNNTQDVRLEFVIIKSL